MCCISYAVTSPTNSHLCSFVDSSNGCIAVVSYLFTKSCACDRKYIQISQVMSCKQRKIAVMGYRSVGKRIMKLPPQDPLLTQKDFLVGKSSLSIQFVDGQFVDSYDPTIENTFTKTVRINSQDYELTLVDTAGQDELTLFPSQYSIDVHGYVLVYSITDIRSFEVVGTIFHKLQDLNGKIQVPVVLVGNKTDLHMERMISYEEGKKLAEDWNAIFLETSAKQTASASEIFHMLLMEMEKIDGILGDRHNCIVS